MKKLYFIRHGWSEANEQGLFSGQMDTPLADKGRVQAKQTGLAAKASGLKVDLIIASPLSRALETAQIVAAEIGYPKDKIATSDLLVEQGFGEGEGTVWVPHDQKERDFKGMETDDEVVARARKALDLIESMPADTVLIVAHGAVGRALRSQVKKDFPMSHQEKLANAQLYEWL